MTEGEYYQFIKYRGEKLRARIENSMARLEKLDKARFNKRIDRYTRDAAESAKNRMRREIKD